MRQFCTVAQVIDWYSASDFRDLAEKSTTERKRLCGKFATAYGEEEVSSCIPAMLLDFITKQKGCTSNHTRLRIKATINRPFNAATAMGLINGNPFRGVRIPKGRRGRDWTEDQFQTALRASRPHVRRLLVFLRFSGCRPGEARELLWTNVLWDRGVCVLEEHKTASATGDVRRIHFNVITAKLLGLMKRRCRYANVFVDAKGQPWTIASLTKMMIRLRNRAGLPPGVKLHGLRHTFATQAIMNGVDIKSIADLLGHASVKTTEIYEHLIDKRDWMNAAANRAIGRDGLSK